MDTRTVFLYGQSMLLALVASSLEGSPHLHVVHESAWEALKADAAECEPNVLIFDLTEACQREVLPLLYKNPGMLLIGLDVETNRAMLVSGLVMQSLTLTRVKELVEAGSG